MKDLAASASGRTQASIDAAYALLSDFESYPEWFPEGVRAIEVTERGPAGHPSRLNTTLQTTSGPIQREFHLHMEAKLRPPEVVELRRVPHEDRDTEAMTVSWQLTSGPQTLVEVRMHARLNVPGFLPVGGLVQGMADRFLAAALRQLDPRG